MNELHPNTQRAGLLATIEPLARTRFAEQDITSFTYKKGLDIDEMVKELGDAQVLGVRSEGAPAELIERLPNLRAIGCYCIGFDKVGLDVANELGIPVFNAPTQTSRSVAELVMGQTYALLRDLPEQNRKLHEGVWDKHGRGRTVSGKQMNILGYGGIGQIVGQLAEGNGMKVGYYDIADRQPLGEAQRYTNLEAFVEEADVLSVHVPGGQAGPLITTEHLAHMKRGAYLINTARKDSIDNRAVNVATKASVIAGAAIDVHDTEPAANGPTFESIYHGNRRVLLTAHLGGSTVEGQAAIAEHVTDKIVQFLRTGNVKSAVNAANLDVEALAA